MTIMICRNVIIIEWLKSLGRFKQKTNNEKDLKLWQPEKTLKHHFIVLVVNNVPIDGLAPEV